MIYTVHMDWYRQTQTYPDASDWRMKIGSEVRLHIIFSNPSNIQSDTKEKNFNMTLNVGSKPKQFHSTTAHSSIGRFPCCGLED